MLQQVWALLQRGCAVLVLCIVGTCWNWYCESSSARHFGTQDIFAITFAILTIYTLFAPNILLVFGLSTEYTPVVAILNTVVLGFFALECILEMRIRCNCGSGWCWDFPSLILPISTIHRFYKPWRLGCPLYQPLFILELPTEIKSKHFPVMLRGQRATRRHNIRNNR